MAPGGMASMILKTKAADEVARVRTNMLMTHAHGSMAAASKGSWHACEPRIGAMEARMASGMRVREHMTES